MLAEGKWAPAKVQAGASEEVSSAVATLGEQVCSLKDSCRVLGNQELALLHQLLSNDLGLLQRHQRALL